MFKAGRMPPQHSLDVGRQSCSEKATSKLAAAAKRCVLMLLLRMVHVSRWELRAQQGTSFQGYHLFFNLCQQPVATSQQDSNNFFRDRSEHTHGL